MTSKQAFSAPHQLQYKTKHSALCIQQQIPTPKLPIAEGNRGGKSCFYFLHVFHIARCFFISLNSEERLAQVKLCCANWVGHWNTN